MSTLIIKNVNGYSAVPLLSTMNLYEHEILLIRPSALFSELEARSVVSASRQQAVDKRMIELVKWVSRGHTLVVLGLTPQPYHWAQQRTSAVKTAIERLPPFNAVTLAAKSGSSVRPAPEFAPLLEKFVGALTYTFVLEGPGLIPLFFTRTTQKTVAPPEVVAGAVRLGEGFVLFTPETGMTDYWPALEQVPNLLRAPKPEFPIWTDQFRTNWETAAFESVEARTSELNRLQAELAMLDSEIDQARQLKQLFVGTGPLFEKAVSAALVELGLQVTKGPHPRADLLVTNGHRVAAIETKGVEAAAKEEYVRQVMMWMPEVDAALTLEAETEDLVLRDYEKQLANLNLSNRDKGLDCKGILILGTFRLTPLDERTQPDFPENVKAVLVRQDICALTGLQLFVLTALARSDETLKAKIRQALFDTRGVLELGRDWTKALEVQVKDS